MADSNIQTLDTVKPITLDEYQERTAHLQENTTSLISTIADRQVQAAGLATQAASLASEVNAVAEQASLSFSKKTWTDTATSGTPITAAELNRLENAISSLTTAVNNLQDSVSKWCEIANTTSTSYIRFDATDLNKYKMMSLVTATTDYRPLCSTVIPVDHFTAFCTSDAKCVQTSFALEPTNYQASAYYLNGYIYIKSRTIYDRSYVFAF